MITKEQAFGLYLGQYTTYKNINVRVKIKQMYYMGLLLLINGRYDIDNCKLILRPFKDMTEEERKKIFRLDGHRENIPRNYMNAEQLEYLISIGIDVFNLKERGWAVYESEVRE